MAVPRNWCWPTATVWKDSLWTPVSVNSWWLRRTCVSPSRARPSTPSTKVRILFVKACDCIGSWLLLSCVLFFLYYDTKGLSTSIRVFTILVCLIFSYFIWNSHYSVHLLTSRQLPDLGREHAARRGRLQAEEAWTLHRQVSRNFFRFSWLLVVTWYI